MCKCNCVSCSTDMLLEDPQEEIIGVDVAPTAAEEAAAITPGGPLCLTNVGRPGRIIGTMEAAAEVAMNREAVVVAATNQGAAVATSHADEDEEGKSYM
jgi:hypothetical protein